MLKRKRKDKAKSKFSTKRKEIAKEPNPSLYCKECIKRGRDPDAPYHERTSHKACPYYVPRLAARNQTDGLTYAIRNVKIGLPNLLRVPSLLPVIKDFVRRMTAIHIEASRLANLYVLDRLEHNLDTGDMTYNVFMRKVFQAVVASGERSPLTPTPVRNPELLSVRDNHYTPQRPAGMPWTDGRFLSQCISLAANGYAANCQNHVIVNWETRMLRWWNLELKARLPFLYAWQRKRIGGAFLEAQDAPSFAKLTDVQNANIRIVFASLSNTFQNTILHGDVSLPFDVESNAGRWWTLLPSLWRLLRVFENANQKGFTILPLMGPTAKYVHFDTDALHGLLRAANIPNVPSNDAKQKEKGRAFRSPGVSAPRDCLPPRGEYDEPSFPGVLICDHWWAWAFNISKVTTAANAPGSKENNVGHRQFACHVATDGLSTSVQVKVVRAQWVAPTVNSYGFDEEGTYHPLTIEDGDRVIALDPGRIAPFTGVYGDAPGDKLSCSKMEYRQRAGFTDALRLRVRWVKNAPDIQRINTETPTAKTAITTTFLVHLRYTLLHRDRLCSFYGAQRWLRLRWKSHIAKEKMWEVMVRRITNGNPRTIVALGDASFAHNSRGHASTPTKQLRKRLQGRCRLRMIDEYRTSIACSLCDGTLPKRTRKWQVKVCQDICLTSWNRDVNAARNIRAIFLEMNSNAGERPWSFRRTHEENDLGNSP